MLEVDRRQVMAYRVAAHGLHRTESDPAELAVFDLGVQDNQRDSVALALAARLRGEVTAESFVDDPRFVLAWTHRGAPHVHRAGELAEVVRALIPLSEADAMARMTWQRKQVTAAGMPATEALFTAARAIREVVTEPMTKGAVSAAVTKIIPAGLSFWCRGCQATHILEQLMRVAAPHAGVRLVAGAAPATLAPIEGRGRMVTSPDVPAATRVVAAYLALHGPATTAEAAGFAGTTKTVVAGMWPDDLAEVRVDGRAAFLPASRLPLLENPPEPAPARLLPPWDPFLQARDRESLVPDKAARKEVWKILGNPGVMLADGEVAGTWRTKSSGKRLDFTLSPFWTLPPPIRASLEAEAERAAATRGFPDVRITWGS
ncbi:DNA glycosylase AlkZ-like family protein [Amycolatopsis anabasis]|uniref:DNA glycosylase AlkZ-like family protein n=1 Tax=Amycolatopsis anabasis TaxID=1840409 RepID=UPI00131AC41B|nr:crosslink repair DNA glycosylase YcaQ family protein [Amycolatopsis anabasis]